MTCHGLVVIVLINDAEPEDILCCTSCPYNGVALGGLLVTEAAVVETSSASAMSITALSPCLPPSDCSSASVKKFASSLVIAGHFIKNVAQCKKVNKWKASPKTRLQPN